MYPLVGLDLGASAGQISRVNVERHGAPSKPRFLGSFVDKFDVESKADPGGSRNAGSGLSSLALLVSVRHSTQYSCEQEEYSEDLLRI